MNGYLATAAIEVPGLEMPPVTGPPDVHYRMISPDYFSVMEIPVVSGRSFTEADGGDEFDVLGRHHFRNDRQARLLAGQGEVFQSLFREALKRVGTGARLERPAA